jgi:hypothetical protein
MITQKILTSRQDFAYFLTANLIIKNKITGENMINNSAKDSGKILVR